MRPGAADRLGDRRQVVRAVDEDLDAVPRPRLEGRTLRIADPRRRTRAPTHLPEPPPVVRRHGVLDAFADRVRHRPRRDLQPASQGGRAAAPVVAPLSHPATLARTRVSTRHITPARRRTRPATRTSSSRRDTTATMFRSTRCPCPSASASWHPIRLSVDAARAHQSTARCRKRGVMPAAGSCVPGTPLVLLRPALGATPATRRPADSGALGGQSFGVTLFAKGTDRVER